jgi:hypothetical protein
MSISCFGYCESALPIPGNLASLELLIKATEQQHNLQVALRDEIVAYEKVRDQYIKTPEDKELLSHVSQRADRVLTEIKQAKLTHLFDTDFLKELNLFAKFAKKKL